MIYSYLYIGRGQSGQCAVAITKDLPLFTGFAFWLRPGGPGGKPILKQFLHCVRKMCPKACNNNFEQQNENNLCGPGTVLLTITPNLFWVSNHPVGRKLRRHFVVACIVRVIFLWLRILKLALNRSFFYG